MIPMAAWARDVEDDEPRRAGPGRSPSMPRCSTPTAAPASPPRCAARATTPRARPPRCPGPPRPGRRVAARADAGHAPVPARPGSRPPARSSGPVLVPLAVGLAQRRGVLDDLVQLGRGEQHHAADPDPAHQHHDPGERAVRRAVISPSSAHKSEIACLHIKARECRAGCPA